MMGYNVACIYAILGKAEKSVEYLEKAVACGFGDREIIRNDPDLVPVRSHQRYVALIARLTGTPASS